MLQGFRRAGQSIELNLAAAVHHISMPLQKLLQGLRSHNNAPAEDVRPDVAHDQIEQLQADLPASAFAGLSGFIRNRIPQGSQGTPLPHGRADQSWHGRGKRQARTVLHHCSIDVINRHAVKKQGADPLTDIVVRQTEFVLQESPDASPTMGRCERKPALEQPEELGQTVSFHLENQMGFLFRLMDSIFSHPVLYHEKGVT